MPTVITTNTLNIFRRDWEKVDSIRAVEDLTLWNHLRDQGNRGQRDVLIKSVSGLPMAQVANEGTEAGVSMPHEHVQLTLAQKRRVIKYAHTIEAQNFDPYEKIREMAASANQSLNYRMEQDAADLLLNNAFTGGGTAIATGQAFYANAHVIGPSTLDNLATAEALSEGAIERMITQIYEQDDSNGQPMSPVTRWLLIVPPALKIRAMKIMEGKLNIDSAENNPNIVGRMFTVVGVPRASSTTAYALLPADKSQHYAYKTETNGVINIVDNDADGNVTFNKTRLYALGVHLPYNTCGNQGA